MYDSGDTVASGCRGKENHAEASDHEFARVSIRLQRMQEKGVAYESVRRSSEGP